MTKMQIIAKAAFTFIGLSAIINLCSYHCALAPTILYEDTSVFRTVLFFLVFLVVTIAIAYFFIFKNDWLVYKMAGSDEKLNPERKIIWLVVSLRIVAVIYGLILLANSISTILNIVVSPLFICHLINEVLTFKSFPKSLNLSSTQLPYMIYNFLKAILAAYLLLGWPQFIRFQLNISKTSSVFNQNPDTEGIKK